MEKLTKEIVCIVPEEKIENHKWARAYREENFINIQFVSIDKIRNDVDNFSELNGVEKALIKDGAVLVKHPYRPGRYIDFNTTTFDLLNLKYNAISDVAMYLGAQKMSVNVIIKNKKKIIIDAKGNVSYKGFALNGLFHTSKEIKEAKEFKKKQEFTGTLTQESYLKAIEKSKECKFEEEIVDLINKRNPNISTKLKNQIVEIKATKEYDSIIDSCAKLSTISKILELDANFQMKTSEKFDVYFKSTLEF